MATAVAGMMLEVNPFDQPDVQASKELTGQLLREYEAAGELSLPAGPQFRELLAGARGGDYVALLPYLPQTASMDDVLAESRRRIGEITGLPTTVGYGPRYLHSSGQMHKGGAANGIFLVITSEHPGDLPVPGMPYGFGVLTNAEAWGDVRALHARERRAALIHLQEPAPAALREALSRALEG
jgi:hypothetical protein